MVLTEWFVISSVSRVSFSSSVLFATLGDVASHVDLGRAENCGGLAHIYGSGSTGGLPE